VINTRHYAGILTVETHEQAKLTHNLPTGVGYATWPLAIEGLGDGNKERRYRRDVVNPDSFPGIKKASNQSLFATNGL
jgi:hypothetical protein